jgi:SAM-dependent methyltransferase
MASEAPDEAGLVERQLAGAQLYGEGLSDAQLEQWYAQEARGFFDLAHGYYGLVDGDGRYTYEYAAMNRLHAIGLLSRRRYGLCVALGCAAGDDVAPLAPVVDRFVAIEPAEAFWRTSIGGKPAQYLRPGPRGDIGLGAGAADLATSFGVLHHIPNVSHVVGEIARVLAPQGYFAVREPITWMGDWRRPRPGLTANERGLPLDWFERLVRGHGFRILRRRLCMLAPLAVLARKAGIRRPYASLPVSAVDWLLSESLRWNVHYRRDRPWKKIAPAAAFWLLQR